MRSKLLFIALSVLSLQSLFAQKTWNGGAGTTNWGDANNWAPSGVPAATDNVTIGPAYIVVINSNTATCKNLSIGGTIQFQNVATRSLTVIADLSGSGSIDMTNATATGILYLQGTNNAIGSFIAGSAGTVNYNGSITQNISPWNYYNLTVSIPSGASSRTKTTADAVTIGGNLIIESYDASAICSLDPVANSLTVNGTSTINARGAFIDSNNTGTNTCIGKLIVNANGNVSSGNTSAYNFSGGITNNGTFSITGTGNKTFLTNPQTIDGSQPITMAGNVIISGAISMTSLNSITLSGTLDGTNAASKWVNGNGSTLNYSNATMPFVTSGSRK